MPSRYIIAGGGGGAPSLMSNGGSWSTRSNGCGIGAGGHGASAWWTGSDPGHEDGGTGGNGALWIYYHKA